MRGAKSTGEGETEPYFIEKNAMGSFPYFLDVEASDKFSVEWVEMTQEQFEALPQFEHVRLAEKWLEEITAAGDAEDEGNAEKASAHQAEADRLAEQVASMGFDVRDLVEAEDLPAFIA